MKVILQFPAYDRQYDPIDQVRIPLPDGAPVLSVGDCVVSDGENYVVHSNTLHLHPTDDQEDHVVTNLLYVGEAGAPRV